MSTFQGCAVNVSVLELILRTPPWSNAHKERAESGQVKRLKESFEREKELSNE